MKSETRITILDEKFKKHLDKGYLSKNSIDDYNRYFSNYVSGAQTADNEDLDTQRIYTELINPSTRSEGKFSDSSFYSKENKPQNRRNFNISHAFAESDGISYDLSQQIQNKFEAPSFRKIPGQICVFKNSRLDAINAKKPLKHSISEKPEEFKGSSCKKNYLKNFNDSRDVKSTYRLSDLKGNTFGTTEEESEIDYGSIKKDLFQSKMSEEQSFFKDGVVRLDLSICERRSTILNFRNEIKKRNFDTVKREKQNNGEEMKDELMNAVNTDRMQQTKRKIFNELDTMKKDNSNSNSKSRLELVDPDSVLNVMRDKVTVIRNEHIVEESTEVFLENRSPKKNLFKENYDSLTSCNQTFTQNSDKKDQSEKLRSGSKNTAKKIKKPPFGANVSKDFLCPMNLPKSPNKLKRDVSKDERYLRRENFSLKKNRLADSVSRSKKSARSKKSHERGIGSKSRSPSLYNLDSVLPLKEPKFDSFETRNSALNTARLQNGAIYNKTESLLKAKKPCDSRPNLCYDDLDNDNTPPIAPMLLPEKSLNKSSSHSHTFKNGSFSPLKIFKTKNFLNKTFHYSGQKKQPSMKLLPNKEIRRNSSRGLKKKIFEENKENNQRLNKTQPLPAGISIVYQRKKEKPQKIKEEKIFSSNSIFKVSFYSLLKELSRSSDLRTKKKLKNISDNYTEKNEYKEKVIDFFNQSGLLNNNIEKKSERQERINIFQFFPECLEDEKNFGFFQKREKSKNSKKIREKNLSWKTKKMKNRCRTKFTVIDPRTRKVLLGVDSLPLNAKKVNPTIQKMEDIRSRLKQNELKEALRPCLFFLNGQGKHLHFFDLMRRKHANVHSPIMKTPGRTIDDYYIKGNSIFVKVAGNSLTFFKISEFSKMNSETFGGEILAVSSLGDEKVMVLTKNKDFIEFYDVKEKVKYKILVELGGEKSGSLKGIQVDGEVENVGFLKLMPDNRVFVLRNDFVIFEMNLRLEMIKMR